jgi:TPP-dependent pyruvate/acetoin dehydrogenase alpha subunit
MPNIIWDRTRILDLYRTLMTIRLVEESFVPVILDGTIKCPVHLCSGEEAVAVGICKSLDERDYIFGSHRSHGHFIAKGGNLRALVAEVYCRETGCSRGRGGSMHLIDMDKGMLGSAPIVAGTISLALGAALASKVRRDNRVVVSFFGDGATGEGVLYEAMNFAAVKSLPIIFACENNYYSTHMPIQEIRPSRQIVEIAAPFGMPALALDGNDLTAVHEAATEVVMSCRNGGGPAFIEFSTYRLRGHVGPNDNIQGAQTDIRSTAEIQSWQDRDPIPRFVAFALRTGSVSRDELASIQEQVTAEVQEAHEFALKSPHPSEFEIEKYVFGN